MYGDPQIIFAAAGLDRSAHLRADATALAEKWADPASRVLLVWRSKLLMEAGQVILLQPSHPVLKGLPPPYFLGLLGAQPIFAADLSGWSPSDTDPVADQPFLDSGIQVHPLLPRNMGFADLRPALAGLPPVEAELAATALALAGWHQIHGFCARCGAASAVIMGGWQRQCPACKALHFPRTDPVVIMLATRGNRVLLGRGAGWPDGFYSLLAGFMEPGETIEAAARREIMEEAGVLSGKARYLASQPWPFPASLMIGCHVEALSDDLCADPAEIEDLLWLSREEVAEVFAGQHPSVRPPRQGAIATYLLNEWLADRLPSFG